MSVTGLSSKMHHPKDVDIQGVKTGTTTRISHHKRHIEHYPNLTSAIRDLQHKYFTSLEVNHKEDTEENRKNYFEKQLKRVEEGVKVGKFWEVFFKVKRDLPKLYKVYLKTAYKAFVNDESHIDMGAIERAIEEFENS